MQYFFGEEHAMDDVEYKEHIGVVFDDLRVPNKLTIKDIYVFFIFDIIHSMFFPKKCNTTVIFMSIAY
jgi:hypothetical protein